MAKNDKLETFSPEVCARLRKLWKLRNDGVKKKKAAEEWRDELDEHIRQAGEQPNKSQKLKADYCDAIHDIDRNKKLIKFAVSAIGETIERGDDLELIPSLDPNPTANSLFKEQMAADEDEEEETEESEAGELVGAEAE